jgi:predicted methyltransferase
MRPLTLLPLLLLACQSGPTPQAPAAPAQSDAPGGTAEAKGPAPAPTAGKGQATRGIGTRHALPLTRAEHHILEYAATGDANHLIRAATTAAKVVRQGEQHDYPRFLLALIRQAQGDHQASQALLEQTSPDRRHFWARYFAGGIEPSLPYLAANVAAACRVSAQALQPICEAEPLAEPAADATAFEQASWIHHSRDRMAALGLGDHSPAQLFDKLGIQPGATVVDLGAGDGWFAVPLARQVGSDGTLWANEIDARLVDYLGFAASHHGLPQLRPVQGTDSDLGLEPGSADHVFACDVLHLAYQANGGATPSALLASIHSTLQPGGQLVVVDSGSGLDGERLTTDLAAAGLSAATSPVQPANNRLLLVFHKAAD